MWTARRRQIVLAALLCGVVHGCSCSTPPPATAVKLVATNTLAFDIFVPNDSAQGGLTVGHASGSDFAPVPETPACPCQECDQACNFLLCDCNPKPMAHRIRPGGSFTRTFDGNGHAASRASCGAGDLGGVCFEAGAPIASGGYDLQLCFATNVNGASQGLDDFPTTFDASALTCVTKAFQYPTQTEWDIAPQPPPPCGAGNVCPAGELCQQGVCSATCLANSVPPVGSTWTVAVNISDDEGFFTRNPGPPLRFTGTGQVGAALFGGGALDLTLNRSLGQGLALGRFHVTLPPSITSLPFVTGETVSVTLVPIADDGTGPSAVVIRDANGALILAAELDFGARVLSADDTAPFSQSASGTAFACSETDICGRSLDTTVLFSAGEASAEVQPGQSAPVSTGGLTWDATAVANFAGPTPAPAEQCSPTTAFGFAIVQRRQL